MALATRRTQMQSRPGNRPFLHELKVTAADGSAFVMVLTDQDVQDIGIGCGL